MKNTGLDINVQQGTAPLSINKFTTNTRSLTHAHTHTFIHCLLPHKTLQHLLCFPPSICPMTTSNLYFIFSKTDSITETQQRSQSQLPHYWNIYHLSAKRKSFSIITLFVSFCSGFRGSKTEDVFLL